MSTYINPSLLAQVNAAATNSRQGIQYAVAVLRASGVVDPTAISDYLMSSKFAPAPTSSTSTGTSTGGSGGGFSMSSITGLMGAAGGAAQLSNVFKSTKPTFTPAQITAANDYAKAAREYSDAVKAVPVGTKISEDARVIAAGDAQTRAESAARAADAEARTLSGGKQGGISEFLHSPALKQILGAATDATLAYQAWGAADDLVNDPSAGKALKLLAYGGALFGALAAVPAVATTIFGMLAGISYSIFGTTGVFGVLMANPLLAAAVIAAAVVIAAVLAAILGSHDAKPSETSTGVGDMLSAIPAWYDTLPSAAVVAMIGGLTIGGMSYNLSPGSLYQQFSVPTVQLAAAIQSATGTGNTGIIPTVLYSKGAGVNGSDVVYMVEPGADGNSKVSMLQLDSNGFVVGKDGPDASGMPLFSPKVVNGKVVGVTKNEGAMNAILQVPACMAIANNASLSAQTRESALATCMRANKNVTFVPTPNPS